MKNFPSKILLLVLTVGLFSCEAEDLYDNETEAYNMRMANRFIYDSQLVGEWEISAMVTDKIIDINKDGETNNDLLLETSCYNKMSIKFNGDKTFSSLNSRMLFKAGENGEEFSCLNENSLRGNWAIKNDVLTLYVKINNTTFEHKRHLILTGDSFVFEVNRSESIDYINDQGGTSASGISVVSLEYTRSGK